MTGAEWEWLKILSVLTLILIATIAGCQRYEESLNQVTYHRDVAPILREHCTSCHRAGEAAPFPLLSYEDARGRLQQIADLVRSRAMPPWLPTEGHEQFANTRRLTDAEIKIICDWAAAGGREGESDSSQSTSDFVSGWNLGEPDLVLESPVFELSAAGTDRFRNFVLTVPGDQNRWVRTTVILPMNPRVTHHARMGIDRSGESARRDAADVEIGYEGMAWGEDAAGQLITWTPGMQASEGMPATAWQLRPEMKLVLHTHLQPSGKPEQVSFQIGFYFADEPPRKLPAIIRVGSRDLAIPAGEADFVVRDEYELPIDTDATFVFPHAHSLCRQLQLVAVLPDGKKQKALTIPRFDENWHDTYHFARPIRLPRGTRLVTEFHYDNSTANPRNPNNPPQRVVYGSNAADEMADVYLQILPVNPDERAALDEHYKDYDLKSKLVGYRRSLEMYPTDPWSREALASSLIALGKPAEAIEVLEADTRLIEDSTQATVIHAMAKLASGDVAAAETEFQQIVAKDSHVPIAWLGLGQCQAKAGNSTEAEKSLRTALADDPHLSIARLDLVDLLLASGRVEEAIAECREAIELDEQSHQPHLKLANILAQRRDYEASLAEFHHAKKLAPYLYAPQVSLAIACYQAGDEVKAKELLDKTAIETPEDPVVHCFLGQVARRSEKWDDARRELDLALTLTRPTSWPASHERQFVTLVFTEQLLLAQALEDADLARAAAAKWLVLEPENEMLKGLLSDIEEGTKKALP